ncbi:MAG: hypothetical protein JXR51_15330 [Bacteroidales bacterium]|nr:hypothetical protein [Bacteroidales bacterium]MBN2758543.1 hypothetical protein [Bacteroidales bacterium]
MKTINLLTLFFVFLISLASCNENSNEKNNVNDSISAISIPEVKPGTFYNIDMNKGNSVVLADTITYDLELKNNDPEDDWKQECLQYIDRKALTNIIFNAVYNGKLTAYNYNYGIPMTIKQVKELEKEYSRDRITKMQFIEEWFFDEKNLVFGKKVIGIMLAYELYNPEGEIRGHTAGILVYFNKDKNKEI